MCIRDRKQLFVGIGGRMEIAVDIGRIGFVPQLLRSLLPGGLRLSLIHISSMAAAAAMLAATASWKAWMSATV